MSLADACVPIKATLNVNSLCQTSERWRTHFQEPGWFTKNVFNRLVAALTQLGISVAGSRVLEVRGARAASGGGRRSTC